MPKIKEPEEEEEEERKCRKEDSVDGKKPKEGVRYKEDEEEDEDKPKKKKRRVEKEDEDEDEDTEKAGLEENPEEGNAAATTEGHTTTSRPVIGVPQNVFVPTSGIQGARMGTGTTPGQEGYSGKSVEPDLMKSPLFVELSSEISKLQEAMDKKLGAVEKSFADRLENINKSMSKIEQFYSKPLYKAISENVNPEAVSSQTISKQLEMGKIRFTE